MEQCRYGILFALILMFSVVIAGCSDQSAAPTKVPPTGVIKVKYSPGDVIGKTASATETMSYVILAYDGSTDLYTWQMLYKNPDGSWGHFISNKTKKVDRTLAETIYPVRLLQLNISSIPIITPNVTPAGAGTGTLTGNVSVGPLCPVEPCTLSHDQLVAAYAARPITISTPEGTVVTTVTADPETGYTVTLNPGMYVVTVPNQGIKSRELTTNVTIRSGETVRLDISIDTGMR
jgi:hypothetical protein